MKCKGLIFRAVALAVIYVAAGILLLIYGSTLHDNFPKMEAGSSYFKEDLRLEVSNDAPLSMPFIAPDFVGRVEVTRSSGGATCRVFVQNGWKACETTQVEIGRIEPGKRKAMVFSIDPRGGDFEVVVSTYPKVLAGLPDRVRGFAGCRRGVECRLHGTEPESYVCG